MNVEIPEFHSEELQQAAEFFGANITQHKEKLDAISNDIKKVEKWFEDLGLHLQITEEFSRKVADSRGEGEDGSQVKESESLAWALDEKSGKWRLCYVRTVEDGTGVSAGEGKTTEARRLREAPVDVMIRAIKALPVFLMKPPGWLKNKIRRSRIDADGKRIRVGLGKRTEVRPLIETPVDVRVRAFTHLPAFLKKAGETLELRPVAQHTP